MNGELQRPTEGLSETKMKSEQEAPASKVHSFCLEYEIFPEMHSKDGFQHCQ